MCNNENGVHTLYTNVYGVSRGRRKKKKGSGTFAFYIRIAWPRRAEVAVEEESKSFVFRIYRSF